MLFPSILAPRGGVSTLSDILFLAKKEFDGKLLSNEGSLTAAGDLATLTAGTGKDMYIARAKVNIHLDGSNTFAAGDEVVLKVNNVIVETYKPTHALSTAADGDGGPQYEFKNVGHRVTAGQIIKLEVITLDTQSEVEGFIECFEEDTGVDPVI